MLEKQFFHLHLHTEYSMLDGAIKISELVKTLKENRVRACAITDHGSMFGVLDFYLQMTNAEINPIIGCEFYIAPGNRKEKTTRPGEDPYYHIVLLAKNNQGYQNLLQLSTLAFLEGFHYKPRIDLELLKKYSNGLITLTACKKGLISNAIMMGNLQKAYDVAVKLKKIMDYDDEDNLYLELMFHHLDDQKEINDELIKISGKFDIPLVATNDAHYLTRRDARFHDIMLCIQTNAKVYEEDRMRYGSDEFYLKDAKEMYEIFKEHPEAVENTVKIADRCHVELSIGQLENFEMPDFAVPKDYRPEDPERSIMVDYFEYLCEKGFEKKIKGKKNEEEYRERLKFELGVIEEMDFPQYFLIVQDFVNWARNNDIPIGPGRGSAAGSLVSYLLGITMVDPIEYDLLFERFLNQSRKALPDIDIDICYERRERVIDYLKEKYGYSHVSQISTISKMGPKQSLRDVGRVLDLPLAEVDKISKLIPGRARNFDEAFKQEPKLLKLANDKRYEELFSAAIAIQGLSRHWGIHAAGLVISNDDIYKKVPCCVDPNKKLVTQYDKDFIEKAGLVKWDLLGLKTLTVIDKCVKKVNQNLDAGLDIENIALDDKETYKLLSDAKSVGVFQLESSGMRELLKKFKPTEFEDIIAILALYRPGPIGSGMLNDFIKRKRGKSRITFDHPDLKPILKETYGIIVYQEQVMNIAKAMGGFTLAEADELRKAMGKKKMGIIADNKLKFIKGAKEKGVREKVAKSVYSLMSKFGEYGFNKSHSTAYGMIAYQTAYLKAHYPNYFMASLMSADQGNLDKIVEYVKDCRKMGIKVLPPDINYSEDDFVVVESGIRFGLGAIKNVGHNAIQVIVEERQKNGKYHTLLEFLERIDLSVVNKKMLESLILCGAMDSLKTYRSRMHRVLDLAVKEALKRNNEKEVGQFSLFGGGDPESTASFDQEFIKYPDVEEMDEITRLKKEKELIGLYITGHPLEKHQKIIDDYKLKTIADVRNFKDGTPVTIMGIFETMKEGKVRSNFKRMMRGNFEDMSGRIQYTMWERAVVENEKYLEIGKALLITGHIDTKMRDTHIIIKKIYPVAQARIKLTRRILLEINTVGLTEKNITRIRNALVGSPGRIPVYVKFLSPAVGEVIVKPHSKYYVKVTKKLLTSLNKIVGEENIFYNVKI